MLARAAARIHGVDEKRVREWKKQRETLLQTHSATVVGGCQVLDSSQDLSQEWSPYRLVDMVSAYNKL